MTVVQRRAGTTCLSQSVKLFDSFFHQNLHKPCRDDLVCSLGGGVVDGENHDCFGDYDTEVSLALAATVPRHPASRFLCNPLCLTSL